MQRNRWSLREWTRMLPWPTCPLAGQARFGPHIVVGSMKILLSWRCWGACQEGVCLDPHFCYKRTSPRFSGELPRTPKTSRIFDFSSGAEGDRTPDLMTASHALSHLSYSPGLTARDG